MIKTVWFDILLSFLLGMLVPVACTAGREERKSGIRSPIFTGVVLFELFFFVPLGAYLYFFHPDWSVMYFFDSAKLSAAGRILFGVTALAVYLAAAAGGCLLSLRLMRGHQVREAALIMLAVALLLGIFSAFTFRQLTQIGTYAQWNDLPRTTTPLYLHHVGYVIALDAALAAIMLLLMIRSFRRHETA